MKKIILLFSFFVFANPAQASGRPAGCPHAWCGCWLAAQFGYAGTKARELWLARNWLRFPHTSPSVGSVAVISRGGKSGHVGIVEGFDANGNPIIRSGNYNNRVATAPYPKGRVIAYVTPQ